MTDDQSRSDARAGLRGPPEVSFLKAVSNFDGCRCCRSTPPAAAHAGKMHKNRSRQDTCRKERRST